MDVQMLAIVGVMAVVILLGMTAGICLLWGELRQRNKIGAQVEDPIQPPRPAPPPPVPPLREPPEEPEPSDLLRTQIDMARSATEFIRVVSRNPRDSMLLQLDCASARTYVRELVGALRARGVGTPTMPQYPPGATLPDGLWITADEGTTVSLTGLLRYATEVVNRD